MAGDARSGAASGFSWVHQRTTNATPQYTIRIAHSGGKTRPSRMINTSRKTSKEVVGVIERRTSRSQQITGSSRRNLAQTPSGAGTTVITSGSADANGGAGPSGIAAVGVVGGTA